MVALESLLEIHQFGHSTIQLDRFITIRAGGTLWGCLHQALRELWGRWRGLNDNAVSRRILLIDIEELESKSSCETFDGRRATEQAAQKRMQLEEMDRRLVDDRREFLRFYAQAAALYVELGLDIEPLTQERRDKLDAERWEHHVRGMIASDLLTGGRVSKGTAELLQCLVPTMKRRIMRECLGFGLPAEEAPLAHDAVIRWYMDYCPPVPRPLELSAEQSRRLIECCESSNSPKPYLAMCGTGDGPSQWACSTGA